MNKLERLLMKLGQLVDNGWALGIGIIVALVLLYCRSQGLL